MVRILHIRRWRHLRIWDKLRRNWWNIIMIICSLYIRIIRVSWEICRSSMRRRRGRLRNRIESLMGRCNSWLSSRMSRRSYWRSWGRGMIRYWRVWSRRVFHRIWRNRIGMWWEEKDRRRRLWRCCKEGAKRVERMIGLRRSWRGWESFMRREKVLKKDISQEWLFKREWKREEKDRDQCLNLQNRWMGR